MNENNLTTATTEVVPVLTPDKAAQLAVIEYRIHDHMTNAAGHLLGVGQCLNEAKSAGLVPHGEWEEWVRRNTGFTVRQAQRMMSAARQVPEGSALAQLPFTKIQACLQLPSAEDAEQMAQRVQEEGLTLRQLQEEIQREKKRADKAEANMQREKKRADRAEAKRIEAEADAEARAAQAANAGGISAEAQAQIDQLRAELEDAEAMVERQAELRQQAQQELLNFQAQAARGETQPTDAGMTSLELAAAVRAFVGAAGVLPHMGMSLAQAPEADKREMWAYVDMVAEWVEGARRALQTVFIDGNA